MGSEVAAGALVVGSVAAGGMAAEAVELTMWPPPPLLFLYFLVIFQLCLHVDKYVHSIFWWKETAGTIDTVRFTVRVWVYPRQVTVCVGSGMVWENPTHGIPVLNTNSLSQNNKGKCWLAVSRNLVCTMVNFGIHNVIIFWSDINLNIYLFQNCSKIFEIILKWSKKNYEKIMRQKNGMYKLCGERSLM